MNKTQELPFEVGKIYSNYKIRDELWPSGTADYTLAITTGAVLEKNSVFLILEIKRNKFYYALKIITLDGTQQIGWLEGISVAGFSTFFETIKT